MTGKSLDDVGRSLSWSALGAFLHKPDIHSELAKEMEPDLAAWAETVKTNAILADIFDILAMINANICAIGTGKKAKKPKKFPRPTDKETKQIGKDALPLDELREWFKKKRKEKKKSK